MIGFKNEQELIYEVKKFYQGMGLTVYEGVPCFSRCIDMVIEEDGIFKAIEFKLHDWRRGLIQADHHLLAVDYSYVCLPKRKITPKMLNFFREYRVGLMIFTSENQDPLQEILPAVKSEIKWSIAGNWLKRSLKEGQYVVR